MVINGDESFKKTWADADVHCMMHGGHLASIHSEDEMMEIADEVAGMIDVWIGLQKDSEFSFKHCINCVMMKAFILITLKVASILKFTIH